MVRRLRNRRLHRYLSARCSLLDTAASLPLEHPLHDFFRFLRPLHINELLHLLDRVFTVRYGHVADELVPAKLSEQDRVLNLLSPLLRHLQPLLMLELLE